MTISELIKALEEIKENHGDVDVTVFQYVGGMDDLCDVHPAFDDDYGCVVLQTTVYGAGIRK